jgi:hypothetical protein
LPRISKLPGGRAAEIAMAIRFGLLQKDRSVAIETEGLGPRPFHGRIAMLINEHSHSAAEMVQVSGRSTRMKHNRSLEHKPSK